MGVQTSTYIGVYLIAPYYNKPKVVTYMASPTTGKELKTPFDPATGEKAVVKRKEIIEQIFPSPYDVLTEHKLDEDLFFVPEYDGAGKNKKTFILNTRNKYVMGSGDSDDSFNIDITEINPNKLIEDFKIEYEAYLHIFEKEFGSIEVHFGIVNYSH